MMTRRLTTAFLIALLISAACTLLLSKHLRARQPQLTTTSYVASAVPLNAGEVLKEDKLKLIQWPTTLPLTGVYTKPKDLVGRSVLYPLAAGEPILDRDLGVPGMGLTTKIPDGMRAVALRSDEVVGVAGFLFPGSHVDVLVTYRSDQTPSPITATVLQDAEVLAAGHQVEPSPDGKPETVDVVTLLMKPEDAERVVLASTQGTIHFVLRNSTDQTQINDTPAKLSELAPGATEQPATAAAVTRAVRHAPKPTQSYVVETILGDEQGGSR